MVLRTLATDSRANKEPVFAKRQKTRRPKRSTRRQSKFTFADLFSGIGGFHLAASNLGGKCVFASEIDEKAREVYEANFHGHSPELFKTHNFVGDIKSINESDVPKFDFLFAGFPCQPFSKGGFRRGFEDTRGTLFFDVAKIIKHHKPPFVLLENVQNLLSHDKGRTYKVICEKLSELGYALHETPLILSPDKFGVSVIRKRLFIPAIRRNLVSGKSFILPFDLNESLNTDHSIYSVVNKTRAAKKYYISEYEKRVLRCWDDFYRSVDIKVIGFPIWAEHFKTSGKIDDELPNWKKQFIIKNRELYKRNRVFINKWLKQYQNLDWMRPTHRKLEWQAGADIKNIYEGLIQFRPSGVRVKRPDKFSTLVAMVHHQILGKYGRRLTPSETKRLQSFPDDFKLHACDTTALKQLGNAVNVKVVSQIISSMMNYGREKS